MPHSEPSRCPECRQLENKKVVCAQCGYEYPEEKGSLFLFTVGFIALLVAFLYVTMTLFAWFLEADRTTLFELLKSQWDWVKNMRIK